MKARIWVAQGKLTKALEWVREQGLSVDDAPSYLREFEHVTLARVLIDRYKSDRGSGSIHEAIGLLERLLHAAEEGKRMGSVIEILVLQALAHQAQGNIATALVPLERALTLAEPEGYVRLFVDEGVPMAELLTRMNASRESGTLRVKEYIHKLLAAFGDKKDFKRLHLHFARAQVSFIAQPLVEPLSENELEVLRLLRTELSGPEIARKRMVSLSTIRTHTQHIYAKLGVNNRRAAVRRAEELGLL
jgi:LuxR family maltose regulon positive regulatory protein